MGCLLGFDVARVAETVEAFVPGLVPMVYSGVPEGEYGGYGN